LAELENVARELTDKKIEDLVLILQDEVYHQHLI